MTVQNLRGYFDSFEQGVARGWAYDVDHPNRPVQLHVIIDGQEVGIVDCTIYRDDLKKNLGHQTGLIGFEYRVSAKFADGSPHDLQFRLTTREILPILNPENPEVNGETISFTIIPSVIRGFVDGMRSGKLRGWVTRHAYGDDMPMGGCQIRVTSSGREIAMVRADRHRRDVGAALNSDPNCGFELTVPKHLSRAKEHTFHFHVVPDNVELQNSPVTTSLASDELITRLALVGDQMSTLFRDFAELRKKIEILMPDESHSLVDYDAWAREYYKSLTHRVALARDLAAPNPLVSVVVPAYRPLISDFSAAVESVIAQTYANWELVIVDDASKSPELTACIKAFCAQDRRIRSVVRKKNGHISEATNTAIQAAKGEWVALFDHDDMLVPEALEVMVRAAQRTGAELLYSDEDKIDKAGYFLEPNLKPDWNHRYMLGCNYACHLSMVSLSRLKEVGPLRTAYNGAQDHDLMLRLSEVIPEDRIHHVAEILYHWRITPNSTASSVGNKDYARNAGVTAVQDHLSRIGRPADVSSINGLTIYGVRWKRTWQPTVCVIVPFREQIDITRRCLEHLLKNSGDNALSIVLVDNWSTSAEAAAFVQEVSAHQLIKVIRVEEPFNYSRLNNIAAASSDAEILCLMNNDLFVDPGWLDAALGELEDPAVGVVGGLFRYPNGTVQHAGVAVGPVGIAAHGHLGAEPDDYGYIGQIKLSREVTAVTAAGLLVRHAIYDELKGLDEHAFQVAFNDVDFCLRVRKAGYKIVYCAEFTAEHHESLSRGSDDQPEHERRFFYENELMRERWGGTPLFEQDPAYSRFFTIDRRPYHDLKAPE